MVKVNLSGKVQNIRANSLQEIIDKLKLNIQDYIIIKNGDIVTETSEIKDSDEIKFISVVSSG